MSENFIQPVTDRQVCFKCHKTATGKKKLSKCSRCHAITYCGLECQKADWNRHRSNCIPVMVKEFGGKGRGVVAARDIKMGEFIFLDKPSIKLPIRSSFNMNRPIYAQLSDDEVNSLLRQVDNLPSEAKLLFYKLQYLNLEGKLTKELKIFSLNARLSDEMSLFLNVLLINHSCAPNAFSEIIEDGRCEVRATKDISKGEEITIFYGSFDYTYKRLGCNYIYICNVKERMQAIKNRFFFDCKCCVCTGDVPDQEDITKELLELHDRLDQGTATQSEEILSIFDKIVDLNLRLYIGSLMDKIQALMMMAKIAYKIEDAGRLKKAMKHFKKIAEDTKLKSVMKCYEQAMRKYDDMMEVSQELLELNLD